MDKTAIKIVREYIETHLDKSDSKPQFEVYTVWKAKVLQNWKYLLSSTLYDGMYYEATYNGDKNEWYLDAYKKFENKTIYGSKAMPSGSEKPNSRELQTDCDTCKWKHIADEAHCGLCGCAGIDNYEPQANADQRIQSVERVETMSCQECRWHNDGNCTWASMCRCEYEPKTEPQTGREDE